MDTSIDVKKIARDLIKLGILVSFSLTMFVLGSINTHLQEQQIKEYCTADVAYGISNWGTQVSLWHPEPNMTNININSGKIQINEPVNDRGIENIVNNP